MEVTSRSAVRNLPRTFVRRTHQRVVAGVAGGIADALGVSAASVRAAFVVLASIWGLGIVLYLMMWIFAFDSNGDAERRVTSRDERIGVALMFIGTLLFLRIVGVWPTDAIVAVTATIAFGFAAINDQSSIASLFDPSSGGRGRVRIVVGVILLMIGLTTVWSFAAESFGLIFGGPQVIGIAVAVFGVVLVLGPWLARLARQLGKERNERIRQEERAEMAAHLHDSVLQTLALIQRTDDPKRMNTLARQQERELRTWLYRTREVDDGETLALAVENAGARVESDFNIPVEVVTVGDAVLDDRGRALVAAGREAMTNAAKHSGADTISVLLEVENGRAELFVDDRGAGFAVDEVEHRGLAHSVVNRMKNHGGGIHIDSAPGSGTEVHLWFDNVEEENP
ncbi:MAG: PspC domain-containing protein [Acidimicrobiia bacterium]|nr:PspC domain-containing protein [Acidimicrobiia bacterium]